MTRALELHGQIFDRLTVLGRADAGATRGQVYWLCQCACGKFTKARSASLTSRNTTSCGCKHNDARDANTRHGHSRKGKATRTYTTWVGMRQRCNNPNGERWPEYGGRGIKVCARWEESFENFLADMGEKPIGMSIDRIDVNRNYEPGNCRWASYKVQAKNRRPFARPRPLKGPKLTPDAVIAIRACHKAGLHGNAIAVAFQVSPGMISMIINEKCWDNIHG